MNCPVERGGCGNKLEDDDGAFCKRCMSRTRLIIQSCLNVTKREALEEAAAMWHWMADYVKNSDIGQLSVYRLKTEYFISHSLRRLYGEYTCAACNYVCNNGLNCRTCIMHWEVGPCNAYKSEYTTAIENPTEENIRRIAKIAEKSLAELLAKEQEQASCQKTETK